MAEPLSGLRVLDLTRVLSGPYATMVLGDLGAEIIKVEIPGKGDDSRDYGPFLAGESAYFMSINRNKKSIVLNLKTAGGREILLRLAEASDVLVENFRPGTMDKLGLGYGLLSERNPRLVYAACSGFGSTGPFAQKPAYDIIVQGMGGIMSVTGHPDGPPTRVGVSIGDIVAGLFTVIAIQAAVQERERSGLGQFIDVSMLDCQLAILENAIARYTITGEVPGRLGNRHPTITPFTSLETEDGAVIFGAGNNALFRRLCDAIGRPDLANDPRFETNASRTTVWEPALKPVLEAIFRTRTTAHWLEKLEGLGSPCGPINTIDKVLSNPQVASRGMLVELEHPVAGKHVVAGPPFKMSRTPPSACTAAPVLGEHTEAVLRDVLKFDTSDIERYKKEGCFEP
ncbi:MAG: CoA transferase [Bacillota bacterium]|nr:CoA transferase [Bacillota bacterium]